MCNCLVSSLKHWPNIVIAEILLVLLKQCENNNCQKIFCSFKILEYQTYYFYENRLVALQKLQGFLL
jgi:hypothetical protein